MRRRHPTPAVTVALGAGVLALALGTVEAHAPGLPVVAELDGGVSEDVAVDVKPEGTLAAQAGKHMPPKPEKGWKKPPCGEVQVEANGACWVLPAKADGTLPKPPCPGGLYEYQGRCFQPVGAVARPDTSIED